MSSIIVKINNCNMWTELFPLLGLSAKKIKIKIKGNCKQTAHRN
jgi:hypothetical protein